MNDRDQREAIRQELASIIEKAHGAHAALASGDARFTLTALEDIQTRAGHASAMLVEAERSTTLEALNHRAKILEGLQHDIPGLTVPQGNWMIDQMPEQYRRNVLKARAWGRGVRAGVSKGETHEPPFESPLQEAHRVGYDFAAAGRTELEQLLETT